MGEEIVSVRGSYSARQRIVKKVSQSETPSYLDINPAFIFLIRIIHHKNVLKFQVPVHNVCEMGGQLLKIHNGFACSHNIHACDS